MTTTKRDRNGIETDAEGYVARIQCNRYHSGNRRLVLHVGRFYECQGCTTYYGADELGTRIAPEYTGGGGLAAR